MRSLKHVVLALIGFSCLLSQRANADTVYADWQGISPGLTIKIHSTSDPSLNINVWTGVNNWQVKNDDGSKVTDSPYFDIGQSFDAFCIEIAQSLKDPTLFTVTDLKDAPNKSGTSNTAMGDAKADLIKELWGGFHDEIGNDDVKAAAFQLSIWNLVYDNDFSVSNGDGNFYSYSYTSTEDAAAIAQANEWLGLIETNDYSKANLIGLSSLYAQDMVTEVVPTPSAIGAGLLMFMGLATGRRRRDLRLVD